MSKVSTLAKPQVSVDVLLKERDDIQCLMVKLEKRLRELQIEIRDASISPFATLLTRREEMVLALVRKDLMYKEIADELHISKSVVTKHVSRILKKRGVKHRWEL